MAIAASFPTIKPSLLLDFANTGVLDPRVTFTRSTTATYYDGVTTAKAEENLILYSQGFDDARWSKSNTTVDSTTESAPDSTSTAARIAETTANAVHSVASTNSPSGMGFTSGLPYVASVFFKKGPGATAPDWIRVNIIDYVSIPCYVNFDIGTGAVGVQSNAVGSITSVGGSWYRCTVAFTATTTGSFARAGFAFIDNTDSSSSTVSYTGATTSDILVWGFQVEQRSSVTAYTPTTTQPITNYIPVLQTAAAGVPRFDHNPTTGEALGLLIEEQRTNLLTYSEQFDDAAWTKTRAVVTLNATTAPNGTLTAEKLAVDSTATNTHRLNGQATLAAVPYTLSLYAKKSELNFLILQINTIVNSLTWFDLNLGTVSTLGSGVTALIQNVGNGWYRCSITGTPTVGTGDAVIYPAETNGVSTTTTADGYSGVYIWGAQLEVGSFPTSYIPTTSADVTRNADAASMTGTNFSSWYNAGEGTLFAEAAPASVTGAQNQGVTSLNDGTSSNRMSIQTLVANQMVYRYVSNSGNFASTAVSFPAGSNPKTAIAYKASDQAGSVNGTLITGITNQSLVPTVTRLEIGAAFGVTSASGTIKKIAYYPQRLTNANLQALTA